MKDRRKPTIHINHERWLVSYADFVTLLFAFFVVLYASAQIDKRKAADLSGAIETAFQQLGMQYPVAGATARAAAGTQLPGSEAPEDLNRVAASMAGRQSAVHKKEDFDDIRTELEKALWPEIKRNEVLLHMEPDGLVVSLREIGFFDSGAAVIKPGAEKAFARVAAILREHACAVRIEGHTDTVPIHTPQFASNWELSTARATEIVKSLTEEYGVPSTSLSAAGYGEFHPVADNATAKGRQLNRRVDLVILTVPLGAHGSTASSDSATGGRPRERQSAIAAGTR